MEEFTTLLGICERKPPPVTGGFPRERSVMQSFGVFIGVRLNKLLNKQSSYPRSRPMWRPCSEIKVQSILLVIQCSIHRLRLYCRSVSMHMMTSSSGNIFRVTDPLWGEPPVTDGFPSQRPVTLSFDVFFDLCLNERLNKQSRRWWFETPSLSLLTSL